MEMPSGKASLFRPPAFTLDLFNDYVDDEDQTIKEELEVTTVSNTQGIDNRTRLLPGFSTPEQTSSVPSSDNTAQGGQFLKAGNDQNEDSHYDDDIEVGVFAHRTKRPRPFRPSSNPFVSTPRVPTLTQQGRLPKELLTGYRRAQQDIVLRQESYPEFDYTASTSRRRSTKQSYGRVHTTLPTTNLIPTGGGGYLVTNSFTTSAQRKRLEQQEKLERVLTDLEECVAACPTDVKLQGKLLHLRTLQNRLEQSEHTVLKGQEAALIRDVEKMLQRKRMSIVKAEFESQARAMVENMSTSLSPGTQRRKQRAYDEEIGSMSPLSSVWSETVAPSERSSSSHPSTGGKTVPPSYYQEHKHGRPKRELERDAYADDGKNDIRGDDEDVVGDDEYGRKTYGGKTIAQENATPVSDFDIAKVLMEATAEEVDEKDAKEDSGDDVGQSSDEDTGDERDIGGKGDNKCKGNDDNEDGTDEENVTGDKGKESNENGTDNEQKEGDNDDEDSGNDEDEDE
ncbi:hypothetical protein EYB25_005289 [Talaromyces marneffei]|uniref:Uncharacterized protein n=1 Tax=Talaromyces marneffei (strain ATCC 18224 / CBS 334.59 / QM 7333) TaxID=441960 RepID=B6QJQ2_TALMQ|nr:hypothetical protein PMAA_091280 [Talaromyces marneffei ATCC 18224]KAE8551402.1 hypothetical protein EYB25_005289 [Talaromyces marneffei]